MLLTDSLLSCIISSMSQDTAETDTATTANHPFMLLSILMVDPI